MGYSTDFQGVPMRKSEFGFVGFAALTALIGSSALAADMAVKAPMTAPAQSAASNWTGCYIGMEGGGAFGHTTQTQVDSPVLSGVTIASGGIGGGLVGASAGCNYQTGTWVLGIEDDFSWTNYRESHNAEPPFITSDVLTVSSHWLDTLRGRVGYAAGNTLWYVTAGAAFADVETGIVAPVFGAAATATHNVAGWTVGGGVEWAPFGPHWSVKAEYLFVGYPTTAFILLGGGGASVELNENIIRAGLNYRF